MESRQLLFVLAAFVAGLFIASLFFTLNGSLTGFVVRDGFSPVASPSDSLNESSFLLFKDRLVIKVDNASIARYSDSGSMLPFITEYSHGLRIKPKSSEEIQVGDIISYTYGNKTLVHRVIEIRTDSEGRYFVTQGDAAFNEDINKVRFENVEWKIIGILY